MASMSLLTSAPIGDDTSHRDPAPLRQSAQSASAPPTMLMTPPTVPSTPPTAPPPTVASTANESIWMQWGFVRGNRPRAPLISLELLEQTHTHPHHHQQQQHQHLGFLELPDPLEDQLAPRIQRAFPNLPPPRSVAATEADSEIGSAETNCARKCFTFFNANVYYGVHDRASNGRNGGNGSAGSDDVGTGRANGMSGGNSANDAIDNGTNSGNIGPNTNGTNPRDDDGSTGNVELTGASVPHWDISFCDHETLPIEPVDSSSSMEDEEIGERPSKEGKELKQTEQRKDEQDEKITKIGTKHARQSHLLKNKCKDLLLIDRLEGLLDQSHFLTGDYLSSINDKLISKRQFTPQKAREYMDTCWKKEGFLKLTAENPNGDNDLLVVTILPPPPQHSLQSPDGPQSHQNHSTMTYKEMGLEVWNWPDLYIRQIHPGSIFHHTSLREQDQVVMLNGVDCTRMLAPSFAKLMTDNNLHRGVVAITVLKRNYKYAFGYATFVYIWVVVGHVSYSINFFFGVIRIISSGVSCLCRWKWMP